jgi:hypothetical protein
VIIQRDGAQRFAEPGNFVAVLLPHLRVRSVGFAADLDRAASACSCLPFCDRIGGTLRAVRPLGTELGQGKVFGKVTASEPDRPATFVGTFGHAVADHDVVTSGRVPRPNKGPGTAQSSNEFGLILGRRRAGTDLAFQGAAFRFRGSAP